MVRLKATGGSNDKAGRTGKIHCINGFAAEVRLIKPSLGRNDWCNTYISLVADQFPVGDCNSNQLYKLKGKDDPTAMLYGLNCNYSSRYNLKKTSYSSKLSRDDVLRITYNKKDQTVNFSCKTFDYF